MFATPKRSPTHPWQKVLKLRLSPRGPRFRIGERVKGQLTLSSYGYATGYEFHLTYYRSIETAALTRRLALGRLVMTADHFDVEGTGRFGFPQRVDALPYQDSRFALSDYVELTVYRSGTQEAVYRQSKPLLVRNSGLTYRPQPALLRLSGRSLDESAFALFGMTVTFITFMGLSSGSTQITALIVSVPLLMVLFHRWLRHRHFASAVLRIGEGNDRYWQIVLDAPYRISLVDSRLTLRVHALYQVVDQQGNASIQRSELYRAAVHTIDALLPPDKDHPERLTVAFPVPDRVLPPSTTIQELGVEWQLGFRHRPAFWPTMRREWNLQVSLVPS